MSQECANNAPKELKGLHFRRVLVERRRDEAPVLLHQLEAVCEISNLVHSVRVEAVDHKVVLLLLPFVPVSGSSSSGDGVC